MFYLSEFLGNSHHIAIIERNSFLAPDGCAIEYRKFLTENRHRKAFLKAIQHPERQTLKQLYGGTQ